MRSSARGPACTAVSHRNGPVQEVANHNLNYNHSSRVWVNDASAYRPIGDHSHRPLATVDVFELLRVICQKSPTVIFQDLYVVVVFSRSVLSVLGLLVVIDRCVV